MSRSVVAFSSALAVLSAIALAGCGSSGGSGTIKFGSGLHNGLHLTGQSSRLQSGVGKFAFVAAFTKAPHTQQVELSFSKPGPGGTDRSVYSEQIHMPDPGDNELGNALPWSAVKAVGVTSGRYKLAFFKGGDQLAAGTVTVLP